MFFSPISVVVVVCKHLFCDALWITIFCAHALFDFAYGMDHVYKIKLLLIYIQDKQPTRLRCHHVL